MNFKLLLGIFICLVHPLPALAYENKVVLAYVEYPPYYGKSLENGGPVAEIIVQAYNKVGYGVTLKFVPWARGLKGTKLGTYDGLFTAWYSKDREQWFVFSDPLLPNELGFYKRKGESIKFDSFEDFRPYKIGIVRGHIYPLGFKEADLKTYEAATDKENLLLVLMNRIDLALTDRALGRYIIKTELQGQGNKLEWIAPPIEVRKQYLIISKQAKGFKEKLEAFNLGLKKLTESGEMNKILIKHGF